MISDPNDKVSILMTSSNPKDFAKKKKANRLAKLKQYKLDARREQWLSQVKSKGGFNGEFIVREGMHGPPSVHLENVSVPLIDKLEVSPEDKYEDGMLTHHYGDSESSPLNSPTSSISSILDSNDSGANFTGSSSSSESMREVDDDGCFDDWEAMADALAATDQNEHEHNVNSRICSPPPGQRVGGVQSESQSAITNRTVSRTASSNPRPETGVSIVQKAPVNCWAWRPDDACRPQSLPNLSKQYSFPLNTERAHFFEDGKEVTIPGKDLFDNFRTIEIEGLGKFETYPNRDSTQYIDVYGIKDAQTMIRGSYRYSGYCPTVKKLADLGYLSIDEAQVAGKTYFQLAKELVKSENDDLRSDIAKFLNIEPTSFILDNLEWLGVFDKEKKIPEGISTNLDALCVLCKEKLVYAPNERDMILMRHDFIAEYPDRKEWLSSTLVDYGTEEASSMSRTVSYPVGIAVKLVLEGKIKLTGLQIPTIPELYNPILDELETLNIKFVEKVEKVEKK